MSETPQNDTKKTRRQLANYRKYINNKFKGIHSTKCTQNINKAINTHIFPCEGCRKAIFASISVGLERRKCCLLPNTFEQQNFEEICISYRNKIFSGLSKSRLLIGWEFPRENTQWMWLAHIRKTGFFIDLSIKYGQNSDVLSREHWARSLGTKLRKTPGFGKNTSFSAVFGRYSFRIDIEWGTFINLIEYFYNIN